MLAVLGVDNPAIEAAFAAVPREHFLGLPPWTASSPFGGARPLPGRSCSTRIGHCARLARGVNNPPVAARQTAQGARAEAGRARPPYRRRGRCYSAILAELVGSSGQVTAVEFDAALAERARTFLSGRSNVRIVHSDGARWPETSADGVYVNFAVARPADRWIEGLVAGGRLVFRSASRARSGRIPAAGIATEARRSGSNGAATAMRRGRSARPIRLRRGRIRG